MTGTELRAVLQAALPTLAAAGPEIGQLDADVGDGDLGVTIVATCSAVAVALAALDRPTAADVVRATAAAGTANPSTLATLLSAGLSATAPILDDVDDIDRSVAIAFGERLGATMGRLGRSGPGDKTVLDPLIAALEAVRSADPAAAPLPIAIDAARAAVVATADLEPRRGRAAWQGERAIGHPDPGAVAFVRFLEALASAGEP
jgi:dihydroxyacetone kinase-like protein